MKTIYDSFEISDVRSELAAQLASVMGLPARCFTSCGEPDGGQPSLAVEIGDHTHYIYHGFDLPTDDYKQWYCTSYTTDDAADVDENGVVGHTALEDSITALEVADAIAFNHREGFFTDLVHSRITKA